MGTSVQRDRAHQFVVVPAFHAARWERQQEQLVVALPAEHAEHPGVVDALEVASTGRARPGDLQALAGGRVDVRPGVNGVQHHYSGRPQAIASVGLRHEDGRKPLEVGVEAAGVAHAERLLQRRVRHLVVAGFQAEFAGDSTHTGSESRLNASAVDS